MLLCSIKFANPEKLCVSFDNFAEVLASTTLAFKFSHITNQTSTQLFDSFSELFDESTLNAKEKMAFMIRNPITSHQIALFTDFKVIQPTNIEAFEAFICQMAGFNRRGELYVLDSLQYLGLAETKH